MSHLVNFRSLLRGCPTSASMDYSHLPNTTLIKTIALSANVAPCKLPPERRVKVNSKRSLVCKNFINLLRTAANGISAKSQCQNAHSASILIPSHYNNLHSWMTSYITIYTCNCTVLSQVTRGPKNSRLQSHRHRRLRSF